MRKSPYYIFRLFLNLSSTAYIIVIFGIKERVVIPFLPKYLQYLSYAFYLIIPIGIAGICLLLSRCLSKCAMECQIKEVEPANHSFLPSYLGYFFIGLSVSDCKTLFYVFIIVFVFTCYSRPCFFNPIFILFNYNFYFVTGEDEIKILLITKQNMKIYKEADLSNLRRINDFSFIDMER